MTDHEYHGEVRARDYQPKAPEPAARLSYVAWDPTKVKYRTSYDPREDVTHHRWDYGSHSATKKQHMGYGGDTQQRDWYANARREAFEELLTKVWEAAK